MGAAFILFFYTIDDLVVLITVYSNFDIGHKARL